MYGCINMVSKVRGIRGQLGKRTAAPDYIVGEERPYEIRPELVKG